MTIDLTNCDREPIHIPGSIQSHGFLIAIDRSGEITYHSENIKSFLPDLPPNLLGQNIASIQPLIGKNEPPDFILQLITFGKTNGFEQTNPFNTDIRGNAFHLIISESGDNYLLEFEPARSDNSTDVQRTIGRSISEMLADKNLQNLLNNSAAQVRNVIGYDRVMVYRFADDGHGEVISESKNDDLESWLGLHYPASDIPKQARELYKKNLTRIIVDVNELPSAILTSADDTAASLDLTNSQLRAVSPIHIQYLKNMGVASSFSISLLYKQELWGLIACHNYTPRFIDFRSREAAKLIGQILSSALEFRQDEENQMVMERYKSAVDQLSRLMLKDDSIEFALTANDVTLLDATDASGAVLMLEGNLIKLGQTPNDEQLKGLIGWVKANIIDSLFYTTKLPGVYPPANEFKDVASGVMVYTLSRELDEYVIWFKPEQLKTIKWAGNPDKPVEVDANGNRTLSPRNSFEEWSETVSATSVPWSNEEVKSVIRLRSELAYALNQKAGAIRLLNERLKQAYEELDTFSYTISHDLKNPLTAVKSYAQILLRDKTLTPQATRALERINAGADKMNNMIAEVLDYSRIGRSDLIFSEIDAKSMIEDQVRELATVYEVAPSVVTIKNAPPITGDPVMISQVFANVISNAIKYSKKSEKQKVVIDATENEREIIYAITDNGLGIDIKHLPRIFELFNRMDNVGDIEGTGVGLAIVKRIVEKHRGKIWADSELGEGSTFYIAFNKMAND
ncbi:GAF domain-containing protein [Mucilaginibacter achroorhodeus]|uniref:histidine kinase n=1 Tax=Mucilaginibacter achroorhodeus TaxID=2599294 RepID=A0A563UAS6_9SPHI|nr:ATP-binding protein [Mucilaginibacter achroorhodeus]TWR28448.1 GAF domain-containing protein [Mucilaginibacter achroorhodeus]